MIILDPSIPPQILLAYSYHPRLFSCPNIPPWKEFHSDIPLSLFKTLLFFLFFAKDSLNFDSQLRAGTSSVKVR